MTFLFYFQPFLLDGYFITQNERSIRFMKKMLKRLCTGFLALATVVTALPTTPVHAESKQYWTESAERVGIVEKVMNDGSIGSTFNEGHLTVEGEDAYCIDINTDFKNGYKTRADASSRMSAEQISDVLLLLNIKQLMRTDWEHFSLLENGLTLSSYNFITILIATGVCSLVAFLYYRFCYNSFKKLLHRQKLARMILENKWYEVDTVQDSGFFTDLQSRSREKIVWFPKIYYQMEKGLLHIRCEITLGKYQDQLLRLEDKLESGLYCELTDKTLHDGYIEYTLLYDMIANRITIDEVRAENGSLRLMKNLVWEYDALPHALIAGGTGGGKTYFLLTLIEALLHTNAVLYVLDPKNADLADLGTVMGNVYHTKEEMIDCVNAFYEGMVQRSEEMKRHPNYKTGENYAYLGLPPCFLIFDEYVAFFEMLGTKESVGLLSQLKKIVMLGRQAGYFLIVACQRPDAKYFSDGIRDNFNFRVGLGRISELGYSMLFGSDVKKQFFQKRIKGRGYCDVGTSVISEFYTPLVPKGHDFLQTIGSLAQARQDGTATCEAKGDGTD